MQAVLLLLAVGTTAAAAQSDTPKLKFKEDGTLKVSSMQPRQPRPGFRAGCAAAAAAAGCFRRCRVGLAQLP